jgi:hypothetical protein
MSQSFISVVPIVREFPVNKETLNVLALGFANVSVNPLWTFDTEKPVADEGIVVRLRSNALSSFDPLEVLA